MKRFPVVSVIIAAALIAAVFLVLERFRIPNESGWMEERDTHYLPPTPKDESIKERHATEKQASPRSPETGQYRKVAIIIDDIGFDLKALKSLLKIPAPLAFAVIPYTPHAGEAMELLQREQRETLLHLPMEPQSYPQKSPGSGALMTNMDEEQIRRQLDAAFAAIPYVSGVNNHMGSRFMEDAHRLQVVMAELKKRGLYFVDSRTTSNSLGREAASGAGVPFAARDIFIDHEPGYEAAIRTLSNVSLQIKEASGPLLLIGHPHADTIRAIETILPVWKDQGVKIVDVRSCLTDDK